MQEACTSRRQSTRNQLKENRNKLRNEEKDMHRALEKEHRGLIDVSALANKLKKRSLIIVRDLCDLKNALSDSEKNIKIVMNTHGAVRGLVRELTGSDESKQWEAASCFCNLALSDSKICTTIAKAAGPYLIAALNNLNTDLAGTCTVALSNLAASGFKIAEILIDQGAFTKLCEQLDTTNDDLMDVTLIAIIHFIYQINDFLSMDHLKSILSKLQELPLTISTLKLLFPLSCHKDFSVDFFRTNYLENILEHFYITMNNIEDNVEQLIYIVRILANFNNKEMYDAMLMYFINNNMSYKIKELLNEIGLNKNMYWLLGNMYNLCNHNVFCNLLK